MNIDSKLEKGQVLAQFMEMSVKITAYNPDHTVFSKEISHDDFIRTLSTSKINIDVNSEELKSYSLGANVVKFKASENGFFYFFLVKKGKYTFNYGGFSNKINYPNLLFIIGIDSGYLMNYTRVFALKDEDIIESDSFGVHTYKIKKKANLYAYPFSNVSSDGRICWGNITMPSLDTYESICELVNLFFESESNKDFQSYWLKTKDIFKVIKHLQHNVFDEDELVFKDKFNSY